MVMWQVGFRILIGPTLSPGPISAERWASIGIGFANDQIPPGQALRYVLHWPQQSAELLVMGSQAL